MGMCLNIGRISHKDLRTAGKNDALASLIFSCAKNIIGALDVVLEQRAIEISIRAGIGCQVNNGIYPLAGLLTGFKIRHIERINLVSLYWSCHQGLRLPISQA